MTVLAAGSERPCLLRDGLGSVRLPVSLDSSVWWPSLRGPGTIPMDNRPVPGKGQLLQMAHLITQTMACTELCESIDDQ